MSRECPVTTLNCSNPKCVGEHCELSTPFKNIPEGEALLKFLEKRFMLYRGIWWDDTDPYDTELKTYTRKEIIEQYFEYKKKPWSN